MVHFHPFIIASFHHLHRKSHFFSSISAKHSKGRTCSFSLGLPPSISDIGLSIALFVVDCLTSFPCHSLAPSQIKLSGVYSRPLYELKRLNTDTDKLQLIICIYLVVLENTVCGLRYKTTTQRKKREETS